MSLDQIPTKLSRNMPFKFTNVRTYGKLCKLKRFLDRFWKTMLIQAYKQNNVDHIMFVHKSNHNLMIFIVYIDGIVLTGNNMIKITYL